AGVLPVVAAGNSAKSNAISYPACLQGAVSVGAVYDSNIGRVMYSSCTDSSSYADKVACFSNSSANLTLLAPGVRISGGGIVMSGTSQA
ncbi:S8 family serine peptidase, partial [Escherichia coli]